MHAVKDFDNELRLWLKLNDNTILKTINITCHAKDSQFPIFSIFSNIKHSCLHGDFG